MAGIAVAPHDMGMNHSQVNFGEVGGGVVNAWHMDSVPYVMVILLSDHADMVGGELLVARLGDPNEALATIRAGTIDPKMIGKCSHPYYPAGGQLGRSTCSRQTLLTNKLPHFSPLPPSMCMRACVHSHAFA